LCDLLTIAALLDRRIPRRRGGRFLIYGRRMRPAFRQFYFANAGRPPPAGVQSHRGGDGVIQPALGQHHASQAADRGRLFRTYLFVFLSMTR
jgi:hypothetical protein